MKFILIAILFVSSATTMEAQNNSYFTEAELFRVLSWTMNDDQARRTARIFSGDPRNGPALAEFPDLGPPHYSEDLLGMLSLLSEECRRKAEAYLVDQRNGRSLTPEERASWETKRKDLRAALIKSGKLRDDSSAPPL